MGQEQGQSNGRRGSFCGTRADLVQTRLTSSRSSHVKELIIGRDPTATVKYDPEGDDLVSRQHAKIVQDPDNPARFVLTDLNSRNGTFVNKQRVSGAVALNVGDVVQLGAGGPSSASTSTRARRAWQRKPTGRSARVPATRLGEAAPGPSQPLQAKAAVGRETVERMVQDSQRRSRSTAALIGAAVVIVIAAVAAVLLIRQLSSSATWRKCAGPRGRPDDGGRDRQALRTVVGDGRVQLEARAHAERNQVYTGTSTRCPPTSCWETASSRGS